MAPAMATPGLSTEKAMASGPKLPVFQVRLTSQRANRDPVEWSVRGGRNILSYSPIAVW